MPIHRSVGRGLAALVLSAMLAGGVGTATAGALVPDATLAAAASPITSVQYYGYGYRPHGYYRPRAYYGYGPRYGGYGQRVYGYGAGKERYRTRRNFCNNQPSRC